MSSLQNTVHMPRMVSSNPFGIFLSDCTYKVTYTAGTLLSFLLQVGSVQVGRLSQGLVPHVTHVSGAQSCTPAPNSLYTS